MQLLTRNLALTYGLLVGVTLAAEFIEVPVYTHMMLSVGAIMYIGCIGSVPNVLPDEPQANAPSHGSDTASKAPKKKQVHAHLVFMASWC